MRISDLAAALGYQASSGIYHHTRDRAGLDLLDRLAAKWPERWTERRAELAALLDDSPNPAAPLPPAQAAALREVRSAAHALIEVIDRLAAGSDVDADSAGEGSSDGH